MKHTIKLTTTGRRSGKPREVTLYAFDDGDRLVIVGSNGGSAENPSWVGNLRVEPRATVQQGRTERAVRAREAHGDEHDRLWALVTGSFPLYASYQRRTHRIIPLFVLEQNDEIGGRAD